MKPKLNLPDLQACAAPGFRCTLARWPPSLDFISAEAFQGSVFLMWVNIFRALPLPGANFSKCMLRLFQERTCSLTMRGTWWECWLHYRQMAQICARTPLAQKLFSAHCFSCCCRLREQLLDLVCRVVVLDQSQSQKGVLDSGFLIQPALQWQTATERDQSCYLVWLRLWHTESHSECEWWIH